MQSNWAVEHLQVIRTLMERTAIYRRALAPVMLTVGCLGIVAAALGGFWGIETSVGFGAYWGAISLFAISSSLMLIRRQALKAAEPFWSPPTRQVTHAVLPPFFAGWITVVALFLPRWSDILHAWWLPAIWAMLYGCALHAAGSFMPRGVRLFGWIFVLTGCILLVSLSCFSGVPPLRYAHGIMGAVFGGLHLAYGLYLYSTEKTNSTT